MRQWYSPFDQEEFRVLTEFSEQIPGILEKFQTGAEYLPVVDNSEIEEPRENYFIWDERDYAESTMGCLRTCEECRKKLETVDHPLAIEGRSILFMVLQTMFSGTTRYQPHNVNLLDDFEELLLKSCDMGYTEMLRSKDLRAIYYPVSIEEQQRNWRLIDLQYGQSLREVAAKIESVKTRSASDSTVPSFEDLEAEFLELPGQQQLVFKAICFANDEGKTPTAKQIANSLGRGAQLEAVKKLCKELKKRGLIENKTGYVAQYYKAYARIFRSQEEKPE